MNTRTDGGRESWIDAARAITIILIVTYHVSGTGMAYLFGGERGPVTSAIWAASQALTPVRIPLFFVVAGVVAHRLLVRPWSHTLRRRALPLLWVFALWSVLFSVPHGVLLSPGDHAQGIFDSLAQIPLGGNAYWFLFVLPLYLVAARGLGNRPFTTLLIGLALYVASPWLAAMAPDDLAVVVRRTSAFFLWFVVGVHAGETVRRVAHLPWPVAAVAFVAFVTVWFLQRASVLPPPLATPLLSVVGIAAVLVTSAQLARAPRLAVVFRRISELTLAIYVVHSLVLWCSYLVVRQTVGSFSLPTALNVVVVPLIVAALVALSAAVDRLAQRIPEIGLLALPSRTRSRRPRDR